MEEYVFAGNRRRWKYVRPVLGAIGVGAGMWLAALCWTLLTSPALPDIGLGTVPPAVMARAGAHLERGARSGWRLP
jgi:hypothetical protein